MPKGKFLFTRRRPNWTLRLCRELDDKLSVAAEKSGRSITEEIEYRLEQSFQDEEAREHAFEKAWTAFEKKKTLEQVDSALNTVEAAIANAKALVAEEPDKPGLIGEAPKDMVQQASKKRDES